MSQYPDIMCDIETTGTDPSRTAMIQLAAVRFNIVEGTVDTSSFFKQNLAIPPGRFWDEGTRKWWSKMPTLRDSILNNCRPAKVVMEEFQAWVVKGFVGDQPTRFWSKPQSFDWPFVSSYFEQYEMANPMSFREAVDMRSYCRAVLGNWNMKELEALERQIPFQGTEHDGLHDALHQIKIVLTVRDLAKRPVVL